MVTLLPSVGFLGIRESLVMRLFIRPYGSSFVLQCRKDKLIISIYLNSLIDIEFTRYIQVNFVSNYSETEGIAPNKASSWLSFNFPLWQKHKYGISFTPFMLPSTRPTHQFLVGFPVHQELMPTTCFLGRLVVLYSTYSCAYDDTLERMTTIATFHTLSKISSLYL